MEHLHVFPKPPLVVALVHCTPSRNTVRDTELVGSHTWFMCNLVLQLSKIESVYKANLPPRDGHDNVLQCPLARC